MVNLDPYVAQYMLVNEDDDEYATYDNINEALAKLLEFPNDHIEVTLVPKPKPFFEWLVSGLDSNGDRKRFVVHASSFEDASEDARSTVKGTWGFGSIIESIVKQEPEPEPDFSCRVCGDPRGH